MVRAINKSGKMAKAALAFLLGMLVLLEAAMAASPALHHLIHADSDDPNHECAITAFAKAQVSSTFVAHILIALPALFGAVALLAETFILVQTTYRFSLGRAPPSAFSCF